MPVLKIDIHEPQDIITGVRNQMIRQPGWEVEVLPQAVSDFSVGNVLGVERKTPTDFLGSFASERLGQQCKELADNFATAVLLIQGDYDDVVQNPHRNFNPWAVTSKIASLTAKTHIVPLFCGTKGVPFIVSALAVQVMDDEVVSYTPIRPHATEGDWQIHLLTALPGIGREKAKALLKAYGTPLRALNSWEAWGGDVDGFGKKTVEKVGNILALRGKVSPEDSQ